jgi:hypothetical protein
LIGSTSIDIEDRWFCKEWRKLPLKPLERRTLHNPTSSAAQGKLDIWVELLTLAEAKKTPLLNIKPPPPIPHELRIIVWGTRDITISDLITEQNDLYVTCHVQGSDISQKETTDTHLRSKKGLGNFNWRMKYPLSFPMKQWPRVRFQVWDKDFFSANDAICEVQLSLKGLCKRVLRTGKRTKILMKNHGHGALEIFKGLEGPKDRFWLENLQHPNHPGKSQGRMEISIELMPIHIAAALPAGQGRSEPNANPFLPPPEGRVKWSLFHPLDMLKEILGPKIFYKCLCAFLVIGLIAMIVAIVPMIISQVIAKRF